MRTGKIFNGTIDVVNDDIVKIKSGDKTIVLLKKFIIAFEFDLSDEDKN